MLAAASRSRRRSASCRSRSTLLPPAPRRTPSSRRSRCSSRSSTELQVDGALKQGGAQLVTPAVGADVAGRAAAPAHRRHRPPLRPRARPRPGPAAGVPRRLGQEQGRLRAGRPGRARPRPHPRGQRLAGQGDAVPGVARRPHVAGGRGVPDAADVDPVPRPRPAHAHPPGHQRQPPGGQDHHAGQPGRGPGPLRRHRGHRVLRPAPPPRPRVLRPGQRGRLHLGPARQGGAGRRHAGGARPGPPVAARLRPAAARTPPSCSPRSGRWRSWARSRPSTTSC